MTATGGRPARRSTTSHFVTRSRRKAPAATPKTTVARRAWRFTRGARRLPSVLGLRVLDAELHVGERLQPRLLDRLAAPHADSERAVVQSLERGVDLLHQVANVVLDREVALALEREGAGVRVLLVEGDLARQIRLRRREGGLLDRRQLRLELRALLLQARAELLQFLLGEGRLRGHWASNLAPGAGCGNAGNGGRDRDQAFSMRGAPIASSTRSSTARTSR